jgi:hypothetical protein
MLHEKNFHQIESVHINSVMKSSSTSSPPDQDSNLAPTRILYIIIGTILIFTLGAMVISCFRKLAAVSEEENAVTLENNNNNYNRNSPRRSPSGSPHRSRFTEGDVMMTEQRPQRFSSSSRPAVSNPLHSSEQRSFSPSRTNNKNSISDNDDLQIDLDVINFDDTREEEDNNFDDDDEDFTEGGSPSSNPLNRSRTRRKPFKSFLSSFHKKKSGRDQVDYESLVI